MLCQILKNWYLNKIPNLYMLILEYLNTYPNTDTFSEMVFGISNTKHFLHPKYNNKSFTPKHQLHHMSPMLQILTLGYRQSA